MIFTDRRLRIIRIIAGVVAVLCALLTGASAVYTITHPQPPACIITGFAPGPHGSTVFTYSPSPCTMTAGRP
jgi:hypothetical protein